MLFCLSCRSGHQFKSSYFSAAVTALYCVRACDVHVKRGIEIGGLPEGESNRVTTKIVTLQSVTYRVFLITMPRVAVFSLEAKRDSVQPK